MAWCLIALAFVNALGWVALRWRYEHQFRRVEIVVDYDDVTQIADASRVPRARFLRALKRAGVTGIALSEQTLATLRSSGQISLNNSAAVAPLFPTLQSEFAAAPDTYFLWSRKEVAPLLNIEKRLREQATHSALPRAVNLPKGGRGLFIAAGKHTLNEVSLGFDAAQLAQVRLAKLQPVALLGNFPNLNAERVLQRLDEVRAMGARLVFFDGKETFGYATLLPVVAKALREREISIGAFEFSTQFGLAELSKLSAGNLRRVHGVSPKETANLRADVLAERYARAARERNVRVLSVRLLHPLKRVEDAHNRAAIGDGLGQNVAFLNLIRRNLNDVPSWAKTGPGRVFSIAISVGSSAPFGDYPRATLEKRLPSVRFILWMGAFLSGLGALGAWLLLAHLFLDFSPSQARWLTMFGVFGVALLSALGSGGTKLWAFALASAWPVIALAWSGWHEAHEVVQQKTTSILGISLRVIARLLGLAFVGGLIVAALLNDWRFFSKTEDFWGTKPAQMVPLALAVLLIVGNFWPTVVLGEGASASRRRVAQLCREFLTRPFTIRLMLIGFFMVFALWFWMARSGNESEISVSEFEWRFRALLERVLMARPRNKEMFLAYPALVFSLWSARRGFLTLSAMAGVVAVIAPIDVLNSFCQANNPLALALWRSMAGAIAGTLLGFLLVGVCDVFVLRPTLADLRRRATPSMQWRRALGAVSVALVLLLAWRSWRAARRYEFLSAPLTQARWPWPAARREVLSRGVAHWLDRSSPDGTTLELFEFDFQADPQLRFALYDQDQDDKKPFDNRAFYWNKGLAPVTQHIAQRVAQQTKGQLVALWNGAFFGLENHKPREKDRAFHLAPIVLNGRAHYMQSNHRWTVGTRLIKGKTQFQAEHLPSRAQLADFNYAMGAAQCLVKDGKPLRLRAYPSANETPQPPPVPSTPAEAGHIPILDFMKTSRISLGWNGDSSKLWLLFVKEPDGETPSRAAVLGNRVAWGGWRLDDVQRFWMAFGTSENVDTALVTDGGDVAQLAFRRDNIFEMVPPRFSTEQGAATRRYNVDFKNSKAPPSAVPPSAQHGGALTYCYIWREKS